MTERIDENANLTNLSRFVHTRADRRAPRGGIYIFFSPNSPPPAHFIMSARCPVINFNKLNTQLRVMYPRYVVKFEELNGLSRFLPNITE